MRLEKQMDHTRQGLNDIIKNLNLFYSWKEILSGECHNEISLAMARMIDLKNRE
jgi:hypothetical protein